MNKKTLLCLLYGLLFSFRGNTAVLDGINWNGFASFYANQAVSDSLFSDHNRDLEFHNYSRLGLNMRSDFNNKFAAIAQLVVLGRDVPNVGRAPGWNIKADWAFMLYQISDNLSFMIGRQLLPTWLDSEYVDVGLTYPYVAIPDHVLNLFPIKAINGISVKHSIDVFRSIRLTTRVFYGNEKQEYDLESSSSLLTLEIKELRGVTVKLEDDIFTLSTGFIQGKAYATLDSGSVYTTGVVTGTPSVPIFYGSHSLIKLSTDRFDVFKFGGKFEFGGFIGYLEYGFIDGTRGTDLAIATRNPLTGVSAFTGEYFKEAKAGYVMVGYRIENILPYYIYSKSDWNFGFITDKHIQHTFGINYRFNNDLAGKIQYSQGKSKEGDTFASIPGAIARSVVMGIDLVF